MGNQSSLHTAVVRFCVTALVSILAPAAGAALTEIDIGKSYEYQQTGPLTTSLFGTFFAARADMGIGDFDGGTLVYPGPSSPRSLTLDPGGALLFFQTPYIPLATLNSEYGFGDYTFNVSNSVTSDIQSATLSYLQDAYTADIPALTAASFTALQSVNPALSLTLNFNTFTPDAAANDAVTFFTLYDQTANALIINDFGVPSIMNSDTIAANTLIAGHSYTYEIIFSDRIAGLDVTGGLPATQYFDVRTFGDFSVAAVPEPETYAMLLAGLGVLGFVARKRIGSTV